MLEHDGVLLTMSYYKGTYVMSRPTGYTNLAVSAAFLASGSGATGSSIPLPPHARDAGTSSAAVGKSAAAMLAERDAQVGGAGYA